MGCTPSKPNPDANKPQVKRKPRGARKLESELHNVLYDEKTQSRRELADIIAGDVPRYQSGETDPDATTRHEPYKLIEAPVRRDFQLREKLGDGAFAVVYRAIPRGGGKTRAVKSLDLRKRPDREYHLAMVASEISTYRGVLWPSGGLTPSTRLVSIRRGRGWFCFRF